MLTYEDCLDICDLEEAEIDAIAEHEHLDRICAVAEAEYLILSVNGDQKIRRIILDDIEHAKEKGDKEHERVLKGVLKRFVKNHPCHDKA